MFKLKVLQDREGKKTTAMSKELDINKVNYLNIRNNLADISLSTLYKIYKMQKKYGMSDREFMRLFREEGETLVNRRDTRKMNKLQQERTLENNIEKTSLESEVEALKELEKLVPKVDMEVLVAAVYEKRS